MARVMLALLTLCGNAPGAPSDLVVGGNSPVGASVRKGGDGVGGIEYKPWTDLGFALPGDTGAPTLVGSGDGKPSTSIGLQLLGAPAGGLVALILGTEPAELAFHGGVLVPRPDLVLVGLAANENGELALNTLMPASTPPGLVLYLQMWMPDPAAPTGWTATNALKLITP